jgi:hypothetical protein
MKTTRKKTQLAGGEHEDGAGVSISIRWWQGGWALAVVIAAVVIARVLGFL